MQIDAQPCRPRWIPFVAGCGNSSAQFNGIVRRHELNVRLLQSLLLAAFAVPFAYFGAQIAAAPFFPDYSILTVSASDLGSNRSTWPAVLNVGAVLTGVLATLGSAGLGLALPSIGTTRTLSWLLAACVASIGLAAAWAGFHPLPSSEHNPGGLGAGMFAAPFVSALVAWRVKRLHSLRWPLLLNLSAFGACALVLSGAADVNLAAYGGLAQKVLAAVCFVPPSAIALHAMKLLGGQRRAA